MLFIDGMGLASSPAKFSQRNETAKIGPGTHCKGTSAHAHTIPQNLGNS